MPNLVFLIQFFFAIVIGLYFLNLLKSQAGSKAAIEKESKKEMDKLNALREQSLTLPLSEKTRPQSFCDIVGQEDGIKALKAALCSPNPQHVIIYGPPGTGKTAAARLVLDEAKKIKHSPFNYRSKFVEMDATTVRFDERSIADPLMGSVHDPIYQGAGPLGQSGIPQPKPGAVTRAHGGVLFLDEIGELHPIQMNKLLKVLEDRKVFLESAYYNSEDPSVPKYIHEIFQKGLPADFRLIGATTRSSEELPAAIRSRCVEIYFRPLLQEEIAKICKNAVDKCGFEIEPGAVEIVKKYAHNGRETVNMVQIASSVALNENRKTLTAKDLEWVVESGHYLPRPQSKIHQNPQVGVVNGLAVIGPSVGVLSEVEATAIVVPKGTGNLRITGIVNEEELSSMGRKLRRKSTAQSAVENVLTVLRKQFQLNSSDYDIHLNFPGGMMVDGPSAGVTVAAAIYSAITNKEIDNKIAMTGELSIQGKVKPIGGVNAKIEAAKQAGCTKVLIPSENWQERFRDAGIEVVRIENIQEVMDHALRFNSMNVTASIPNSLTIAMAEGIQKHSGTPD
ncbi:ATP-dependent protease LonB [Geosporobacter ferrireducens]|uniref:endopeptidase La n=1 Tax=Geosporobacter ferrireducens TaxID=1424294 RepID=A0A1D8GFS8_9FIRM|nr:ATP-dependent protease LonB [Geosporobacter ferrireducens]AOT69756.1 ATP-dependent protease LonB [Geosporobacter ferrireducens]MTI54533.1 ATP-dependent protease LonB [Geosporobacter ferrireducens]